MDNMSRIKNLKFTSLDRISNYIFSPYDDSVYFEFIFNGKAIDTDTKIGKEQDVTIEFLCCFDINYLNKSYVKRNIIINKTSEILQRTIPQERWM